MILCNNVKNKIEYFKILMAQFIKENYSFDPGLL